MKGGSKETHFVSPMDFSLPSKALFFSKSSYKPNNEETDVEQIHILFADNIMK
jgi:hypothetical protein